VSYLFSTINECLSKDSYPNLLSQIGAKEGIGAVRIRTELISNFGTFRQAMAPVYSGFWWTVGLAGLDLDSY